MGVQLNIYDQMQIRPCALEHLIFAPKWYPRRHNVDGRSERSRAADRLSPRLATTRREGYRDRENETCLIAYTVGPEIPPAGSG
jgi:hypothetical protein